MGAPVQQGMESAFNADFSRVQIHTGPTAVSLSNEIGAKAFTYQNHIFFNDGNYQPETQNGRFLLAHELTHTVQQGAAVKRSEYSEALPELQTSLLDDALSWLSGYADYIPGYALFKVIIGVDLFSGRSVPMTPENLIRGIFGLLGPLGILVYDKLAEYHIVQNAYTWLRGQLHSLNLTTTRLRQTFEAAWNDIHIFNGISGNVAVLQRHFGPLLDGIETFAHNSVDHIIQLLKNALVRVLRAMAIDRLPAYRLLTKILHRDPLTGEEVPATTVEILEDFLRMINANDELEQMRERGTLQRTADWIDGQLGQFMSLLDELGGIFQRIWALFSLETLRDITGKLEEIITAFTKFVQRVFTFASNVAIAVLQFIKDSLLSWLGTHANGIRGYRLMTVLLGKDPVTDQVVESNARNILSGFVELVAGPEKFQEIEQSGAIDRMVAWLEGLITRTGITLQMVVNLFTGIWNSLTIQDLIHPLDAFERVIAVLRDLINRVLTFIVEVIRKVVEIILELMNFPSELIAQIIQRAMAAIEDIKRDPLGFLKNIIGALKLGFQQFFGNIGTHLLNGLKGWLFGELQQAGIRPPQDLTLRSIVGFVFEVLNISMERIWQKLAEHPQIGPQRVARVRQFIETASGAVEGAWAFIQDIQREGIGAIWRHLQEQLANLWNTVLESVQNWVMEQVINQMVARLLSMLDPTGIMAIINSAMVFYRAVQSFIERLREILEVINSFVGGIAEIARGSLNTAANFLESTMGRSIPVVIGFLANQVGLRGLGTRIGEMVGRAHEMVDQGLTWLVNKAVTMGRRLLDRVMGRRGEEANSGQPEVNETIEKPGVEMAKSTHKLIIEIRNGSLNIKMQSREVVLLNAAQNAKQEMLQGLRNEHDNRRRSNYQLVINALYSIIEYIKDLQNKVIEELGRTIAPRRTNAQLIREITADKLADIANSLKVIGRRTGAESLSGLVTETIPPYRYLQVRGTPSRYIRGMLYEGMFNDEWKSTKTEVKARGDNTGQTLLQIRTRVRNAYLMNNNTEWQLLQSQQLVDFDKNISNYSSVNELDRVAFQVDHNIPVASYWNSEGKSGDDLIRRKHFLEKSNLRIITRRNNARKGSGGDYFDIYVTENFKSSIAENGIPNARTIRGVPFLDSPNGQPI